MDTPHRTPLNDLPLEQFFIPSTVTGHKTPRKHKRPLSPSTTTPFNPAKRRVLNAEGITHPNHVTVSPQSQLMFSNAHTVTPTWPSRLGNGTVRNYGRPHETLPSPLQPSSSRKFYPKPTIESSTDPQSRHYPGFDIFQDNGHRWAPTVPGVTWPSQSDGGTLIDRTDEDKENMPLRRRAKKLSSKRRLSPGLVGLDSPCSTTPAQTSKVVVYRERTAFSARHALR